MVTTRSDVYYDPYDFAIDTDPYPVWKRLRDEAPLYYNEQHDFYALSRYVDVDEALTDAATYISGHGTVLDVVKSGVEIPPGIILWEDAPIHDLHRSVLARVFTPRRMAAVEDKVREFCLRSLDPLVDAKEFDFIADLGAQMPVQTIGYLLGVPDSDLTALRESFDAGVELDDEKPGSYDETTFAMAAGMISEYIDWRYTNPSDDLMTELINAEVEELDGSRRRLTRDEVVMYATTIAGAGSETTTRLIGWAGILLGEHADQRRKVAADLALVPQTIEEVLRYEAPSPVQARVLSRDVEIYGETLPQGTHVLLINGSANRDERAIPNADVFDIERAPVRHLTFGRGPHFCLGAALARLEGRVALEQILRRWSDWEIDVDRAVQAHTSSVRGWSRLPARTAS
jgi:cytochrome P450